MCKKFLKISAKHFLLTIKVEIPLNICLEMCQCSLCCIEYITFMSEEIFYQPLYDVHCYRFSYNQIDCQMKSFRCFSFYGFTFIFIFQHFLSLFFLFTTLIFFLTSIRFQTIIKKTLLEHSWMLWTDSYLADVYCCIFNSHLLFHEEENINIIKSCRTDLLDWFDC